MKRAVRRLVTDWIPPVLLRLIVRRFGPVRFSGRYHSWTEAVQASEGYDSEGILERVRDSMLRVIRGEAAYERDSVLFDEIQYSWPLAAGLLWIASRSNNRLNLIDFGGSLGSSYYQNRKLLGGLDVLHWNVVEQRMFVECGREYFENQHVRFYGSLDECLREQRPDAILLSSVLQYLEDPYGFLRSVLGRNFPYIVIDRTPFVLSGPDRLTVQKVSPPIYRASYPAWFFNREKFRGLLTGHYDIVAEFDSQDKANIASEFKGFILKRRAAELRS